MNIVNKLNKELLRQDFPEGEAWAMELEQYKEIAYHYAYIENVLSVLSDMHTNQSYLFYGGFAKSFGMIPSQKDHRINSIWEEDILQRIHTEDLSGKFIQELQFFHFLRKLPPNKRSDYYLASKLPNMMRYLMAQNLVYYTQHREAYLIGNAGRQRLEAGTAADAKTTHPMQTHHHLATAQRIGSVARTEAAHRPRSSLAIEQQTHHAVGSGLHAHLVIPFWQADRSPLCRMAERASLQLQHPVRRLRVRTGTKQQQFQHNAVLLRFVSSLSGA